MSVTQYTIGCGYELLKLKDTVFFLSKNSLKTITIDNGEAYATFVNPSPQPPSPNRLKGFNVKLTETESLDERYKFTKQLTMSIHGHLTDSRFLMDDDYYIVVQTEDGTYYLVNVDFPSKMTYTYNLSEGQNQTDFTFNSNSNHPTLKLNWSPTTWNTCQTYQLHGIDSLKLLEKAYTSIDSNGVINLFDGHEFNNVDFLKNTAALQEAYDGEITTTTISFEIPFNNYKPSWQYNLLEFDKNLYAAHITPKNSTSGIFAGYEHGLQPSYELNGSATVGESTTIKITLTEASEWGLFEFDTWSYYRTSTKDWIGVDSEVKCLELGFGINSLMQEVDGNGTPTGRYKCLEGYESEYSNYNIIGTYTENEAESFKTSKCTRFRTRGAATSMYTCINGDKYELVRNDLSYDGGKHWIFDDGYYTIGDLIESGASECEIEPEIEWVLNEDKFVCLDHFERWIPSGYTCINGDKYQNNYKQVSDDNEHWTDSDPLEWSASTVIEYDSDDCKIYRWVECGTTCVGFDKYQNNIKEQSSDNGQTWTVVNPPQYSASTLIEANSQDCGYTDPQYEYLTLIPLEDTTFTITSRTEYPPEFEYSLDDGTTWITWSGASQATTATIQANQKMRVRCYGGAYYASVGTISSTGRFNLFGNIMSLIDTYNFSGRTTLVSDDASDVFMYLFQNARVVNAENLVLPLLQFNKSDDREYYGMFQGCTELVKPPKELPATSLGYQCYRYMFNGCISMTESPIIKAPNFGYSETCARMFENCSSLSKITCYATYNRTFNYYYETSNWVNGVAANGTFYKASTATKWQEGVNGIPSGWTVVDIT